MTVPVCDSRKKNTRQIYPKAKCRLKLKLIEEEKSYSAIVRKTFKGSLLREVKTSTVLPLETENCT